MKIYGIQKYMTANPSFGIVSKPNILTTDRKRVDVTQSLIVDSHRAL